MTQRAENDFNDLGYHPTQEERAISHVNCHPPQQAYPIDMRLIKSSSNEHLMLPAQNMYEVDNRYYYHTPPQNIQLQQQRMQNYQVQHPVSNYQGYAYQNEIPNCYNKRIYPSEEYPFINKGYLNQSLKEVQDDSYNSNMHIANTQFPKYSHIESQHQLISQSINEIEQEIQQQPQNLSPDESMRKSSIYSYASHFSGNCLSNRRVSVGTQEACSQYSIPSSSTFTSIPCFNRRESMPTLDIQASYWGGNTPQKQGCDCSQIYACSIHSQAQYSLPINNSIKLIAQEDESKKIQPVLASLKNQSSIIFQNLTQLGNNDQPVEIKKSSIELKKEQILLKSPFIQNKAVKEKSEHSSSSNSSDDQESMSDEESEYQGEEEVKKKKGQRENEVKGKKKRNQCQKVKSVKKYKPKKKYKQSRQKNVFKNFGNALMNCIENNFVIRDLIEKKLESQSLIDDFHTKFLKLTLNNLKNKDDFLSGWKNCDSLEVEQDEQHILFKSIFKEISLKFFQEYAEKYVNESDKLKNKDIHIKAIPIFIKGISNTSELQKFKLS